MKEIYTPRIYIAFSKLLSPFIFIIFLSSLPVKTFASVSVLTLNAVKVENDNAGTYTVASSFMAGQSFVVYFTSTASGSNSYIVQLSDNAGSFSTPVTISAPFTVMNNVSSPSKMLCTIPLTSVSGTYSIRVSNKPSTIVTGTSSITVASAAGGFCIGTGISGSAIDTFNISPSMGGVHFYDNGGPSNIYMELSTTAGVNFNNTASFGGSTSLALVPPSGYKVVLTFNSYVQGNDGDGGCDDQLDLYNGISTSGGNQLPAVSPVPYCFGSTPGTFTSTDVTGALTVDFFTDNTVADNGWDATVTYIVPAPTGSTTQNVCPGGTLNDLTATVAVGAGVKWYTLSAGGTLLPGTTTIVSGTQYFASQTAGTSESTSRLAVTATVKAQWLGGNVNWNDPTNWCTGVVPTSSTDVTITGSPAHDPTISTTAACHTLDVQSGHTLTITTGGDLSLYGNLTLGGSLSQSAGTLEFSGNSNQSIPALTAFDVNMNNSAGITLSGNLTITDALTLTLGKITTGANSVIVNSTSSNSIVRGTGNTRYTLSWINGNLKRFFTSGSTATWAFPVGSSTSSHAAIVKSNSLAGISSFTASFGALATGGNNTNARLMAWETSISGSSHTAYTSINSGGSWKIEPNTAPTGGTYDISLYFINSSNGFSGLADNEFGILKRPVASTDYADFKPFLGTLNAGNGSGRKVSDSFALRMGLSSFSEFGIGQSGSVLPIQLTSFTTEKCDNDVNALLKWNTAAELNNDYFDVEEAAEPATEADLTFNKIGTIKGNGTSGIEHSYSFIDYSPGKSGTRYYRLRQVDEDGTESYSTINALTFNASVATTVSLFPAPNNGQFTIAINGATLQNNVTIDIINLLGQTIFSKVESLSNGQTTENVSLSGNTAAGLYFVRATIGNSVYTTKVNIGR